MIYNINRNNITIASVQAEGSITRKIMGEELVAMSFSLSNYVDFNINDTVEVYGNSYTMLRQPVVEKVNTTNFKFTLSFTSVKYQLAKVQFFFPDANNDLTTSEFSITGTANVILGLVKQNIDRILPNWSLGTIDVTEGKTVSFNADNCLTALAKVAEEFEIEYWVDGDKTIHLTERTAISGYTFKYGQHNGLLNITRTPYNNSNIVTRLYARGSTENIPADYRNYSKKLHMPVTYLENNISQFGIIEHLEVFEDVMPERLGTVTAVDDANPLLFTDANIDFDLNEFDEEGNTTILINDVPALVTFNSGQLAGYSFEIKDNGYNSTTKTFELLVNVDEKDLEVPSELLRPAIGDTYVITQIMMPESYITNAELLLQQKAQEYLDENSVQRHVYSFTPDRFYFESLQVAIVLGNSIKLQDGDFDLDTDLRVISLVQDLQDAYNVQFEVAEKAVLSEIVLNYLEQEKDQVSIKRIQTYNRAMARRSYLYAKEFQDNVFDGEGYFDAERIKPLSIETKMLTVGSRMQQFNLPEVAFVITDLNTSLTNSAGKLLHLSLEDAPREWNIAQNTFSDITNEFHYIYIKAEKVGTNATVLVSTDQILVDEDEQFYHFEAGYLSSIIDDYRRIKTTYGFTQVSPGEITTGRISSANGQQYIDLLQDKININANVSFGSDSDNIGGENIVLDSKTENLYYNISENRKLLYENNTHNYTFSVDALCTTTADAVLYVIARNKLTNTYEVIGQNDISLVASELQRIKCTANIQLNIYGKIIYKIQDNEDTLEVTITKPKLELGNIATSYSKSDDDFDKDIEEQNERVLSVENKTDFVSETTIENNVVATGVLMVGDEEGANAGITGVSDKDDESVRFFAGSTFSERNTAGFRVLDNGTVVATKATIKGHIVAESGSFKGHVEAESGTFNGEIKATSGHIGNFSLIEEKLISELDPATGTPHSQPNYLEIDPFLGFKVVTPATTLYDKKISQLVSGALSFQTLDKTTLTNVYNSLLNSSSLTFFEGVNSSDFLLLSKGLIQMISNNKIVQITEESVKVSENNDTNYVEITPNGISIKTNGTIRNL